MKTKIILEQTDNIKFDPTIKKFFLNYACECSEIWDV